MIAKLTLAATLLTGCFWTTTKSEGEAMRKDITELNTRLAAKEASLDDKIKELQKVLDD